MSARAVHGRDSSSERAEIGRALGASLAEHQPQKDVRVMLDPDGHPFCLYPDAPSSG
ncbi:VOC family protein [Desertihabitans aurantiacus]|uniref:VOC family protein n=1 Tax=Desertihabitans aurantiacus TaxID=2282477 RepID=UPI001E62139A|nr:VOC family protein [Desertihabitans aurantiacus]